ncbi:dienelactone hydrolase family protein [Chitinilyticum piscinae]|uniref:Dienelactone hydrolase family protein n=1 Tax=Chitinilyticum piscinae TaxID=2866724 RepID=A0A8J7FR55_9NEIS|nr:dienelactone hydrolase family protein [Chitinilyticum piscinae]MBE9609291.1 dienelactone hydrolase family protein [Chitinilyticum piscinae]
MQTLPRRSLLEGLLATGFALAVRPVSATTIVTPAAGLQTGFSEIPVADGSIPAFHAAPLESAAPLPVILVIQEIFGVHEHIQDLCRRLAGCGYLAIAPELFFREGNPRQYSDIAELIRTIVSRVPDEQVLADLDAALRWAARHGGDPARSGITGFCWGGRISWLYARHNPAIRAAAAWYGRLGGEQTPLTPQYPLDIAAELRVPVLGLYAGRDKGISMQSVDSMRQALGSKSGSKIIVYPDAEHGFNADYRPSYNAAAAQDGWQNMLAWFREHGLGTDQSRPKK